MNMIETPTLVPREFDLLAILAEHSDRVVTTQELIDGLPTVYDAHTVQHIVSVIRHKIGLESIETIPRVGYRLGKL